LDESAIYDAGGFCVQKNEGRLHGDNDTT
jgi:hypothetical protein